MKQAYQKFLRPGTGPTYSKIFKMIEKNLLTDSKSLRQQIDKTLVGELDVTIDFLIDMGKAGANLKQLLAFKAVSGKQGRYRQLLLALNSLSKDFFNGTTIAKTGAGWSPDHSDISMVGVRLVVVFDALNAILVGVQQDNKTDTGRLSKLETKRMQAKTASYAGQTLTVKQIQASMKEIQGLIAIAAGLANNMKQGVVFSPKDYATIREEYLAEVKYDLTSTKEKFATAVDGKPLVKIVTRDKFSNTTVKGSVESYLGHALNKQIRGAFHARVPAHVLKNLRATEKAVGETLHSIKGSKAPMDELVKETIGKLTNKPYKKSASKTTLNKKGQVKSGVKKVDSAQLRMHKAAMNAQKEFAAAAVLADKVAKQDKKEGGEASNAKELAKLKNQINKRLPAQVRRNMGFPRLTNRTGIFSNSARVISLRNTDKGISGEYGYMLTGGGTSKNKGGVYETFENTGSKQWKQSYNPKPLIAKSIRDLAVEYTDQKFVSLRRD